MTAEETETECEKEVSFRNKNPKPAGKLKYFWNECVARPRRRTSITNHTAMILKKFSHLL